MTITDSISGQSIGTSTNKGEGKFPQKVTAVTTTTIFLITARVTNGAGEYDQGNRIRIWYASSHFNLTAANAVLQLNKDASFLDIVPKREGGGVSIRSSLTELRNGEYIYFWCDIPGVTVAQTLDVSLVEYD